MKKMILLVAVLAAALAVPSAASFASGSGSAGPTAGAVPPQAQTSKNTAVRDCDWATRQVRFMAVRVKKVRKRVANGQLPVWKLKAALRIYKQALRFKNGVCASPGPGGGSGGGGNPTPLALTATEVQNRVLSRAGAYCDEDGACQFYGAYAINTCDSFSTYVAVCYGWNDEDGTFNPPFARCSFREVVSRTGYNGITSYHDTSYGASRGGWVCV